MSIGMGQPDQSASLIALSADAMNSNLNNVSLDNEISFEMDWNFVCLFNFHP